MSGIGLPQVGSSSHKSFDFTKRKRWADLLVTELADGINFILSASCVILYCGPAVTELIGWKDVDLIDREMLDLVTPGDQATFRACFEESMRRDSEFLAYIRLKGSESPSPDTANVKDVLFEIKGHPYVHETEGKFFFATAKPYPSRNVEMLNTFLELKTENEQLQRRLLELQSRLPEPSSPSPSAPATNQMYATSPIHSHRLSASGVPPQASIDPPSLGSLSGLGAYDNMLPSALDYNDGTIFAPLSAPLRSNIDDENEDGSKKKKLKKAHLTEQYVCVTCGRTDSPEWRKGPLGPKTLCNACGLRWAKQVRKHDDATFQGDIENI